MPISGSTLPCKVTAPAGGREGENILSTDARDKMGLVAVPAAFFHPFVRRAITLMAGHTFDLQQVAQNCEVVLLRRVQAHAAEVHAHWGQ